MSHLLTDLSADAPDLVSVMLRRFATTDQENFFEDFAEESEHYPDEIGEIILGLVDILGCQEDADSEAAHGDLAAVGTAILALYDLTRPERDSCLTLGQDVIARGLIGWLTPEKFSGVG